MNKKLIRNKAEITAFCERHYITWLAVFGSALRDDFGPDSDVDVLVDFIPGRVPGFSDFSKCRRNYPAYSADAR